MLFNSKSAIYISWREQFNFQQDDNDVRFVPDNYAKFDIYKWWRIAKSVCKINKCNKVSLPIKHEGKIIIHPSEKCDIFNKYFAYISNIEKEPNLPNEDFARDNICPELMITEQEVKDQLDILNNSKPSGPDGVAPRILCSVTQCLVSPLTLLFNQSLQCGQLPYIWKRSHVRERPFNLKGRGGGGWLWF